MEPCTATRAQTCHALRRTPALTADGARHLLGAFTPFIPQHCCPPRSRAYRRESSTDDDLTVSLDRRLSQGRRRPGRSWLRSQARLSRLPRDRSHLDTGATLKSAAKGPGPRSRWKRFKGIFVRKLGGEKWLRQSLVRLCDLLVGRPSYDKRIVLLIIYTCVGAPPLFAQNTLIGSSRCLWHAQRGRSQER